MLWDLRERSDDRAKVNRCTFIIRDFWAHVMPRLMAEVKGILYTLLLVLFQAALL